MQQCPEGLVCPDVCLTMASAGTDQEKSFCGGVFDELILVAKQKGAGLDSLAFDQLTLCIHFFIRLLLNGCQVPHSEAAQ